MNDRSPGKCESYHRLYGRRSDKLLELVLPMGESFDRIEARQQLLDGDLKTILDAAAHPRRLVWQNAVELLQPLSAQWSDKIGAALLQLFNNTKSHARFAAVCSLTPHIDATTQVQILRAGLCDKSSEVRWKSSDVASRLERRELIADLNAAIAREKNKRALAEMILERDILLQGYSIRGEESGKIMVTILSSVGKFRAYGIHEFDQKLIADKGIDALVKEVRSKAR